MSWLWASDWDYFYLTQYHTKEIPSIDLLLILFMHVITLSQKTSRVVQGAESSYISLGNSSVSHIWSSGLFFLSLSYSWPRLNKRIFPLLLGCWRGYSLSRWLRNEGFSSSLLKRAMNGYFFLACTNQQVTYYVKNRQHYSYHHSFSRRVMTERTEPPLSTKRAISVSDSSTGWKCGS